MQVQVLVASKCLPIHNPQCAIHQMQHRTCTIPISVAIAIAHPSTLIHIRIHIHTFICSTFRNFDGSRALPLSIHFHSSHSQTALLLDAASRFLWSPCFITISVHRRRLLLAAELAFASHATRAATTSLSSSHPVSWSC